jgi:hypothetical protein
MTATPTTQLWELADAGHAAGLRTHPAAGPPHSSTKPSG